MKQPGNSEPSTGTPYSRQLSRAGSPVGQHRREGGDDAHPGGVGPFGIAVDADGKFDLWGP